jgi:hypothetical protein
VEQPAASQRLPFWPHVVAAALGLIALGYATGRVRAPATAPEPSVAVPERSTRPAVPQRPTPPEPQLNVPIFELRPARAAQLEWPSAAQLATFVLSLGPEPPREEYALRIRAKDGEPVLSAEGLKATRAATLTLAVPRRMMPPGSYVFELLAPGSQPVDAPLRSYAVEVEGR